jgi:galactokinase
LFASHASSRDLFGNSIPELDTLVELLEQRRDRGVIGARLTGGGFGGAVMALTTGDFTQALAEEVLAEYRGRHPQSDAPAWLHVTTGDGTRMTG